MEILADLGEIFDSPVVRLDIAMLKKYNPRKYPFVSSLIDRMGRLSSEAQRMKRTLTTYDKILDSTDEQFLYILWEPGTRPNHSVVVGLLKVGYKNLYLFDRTLRSYKLKALCVLDFFVHPSKQRQGFGHRLFDSMLERESLAASAIAIDKPSESLLSFLSKHYGLANPIWQSTNFVVYPEFFQIIDAEKDSLNGHDHDKSPPSTPQCEHAGGYYEPSEHRRGEHAHPASSLIPNNNMEGMMIAPSSKASVSNAQMAKGRKINSMDHQHLW